MNTAYESCLKRNISRKNAKQVLLRAIEKSVAEFSHSLAYEGSLGRDRFDSYYVETVG